MKVWVKICGVTRPEDAGIVVNHGADAVGINFWEGSRRYCSPEGARRIVDALGGRIPAYGVFVGRSRAEIEEIVRTTGITGVQLHGGESSADAVGYTVPVLRAVAADSADAVSAAIAEASDHRVLFDTPKSESPDGVFGGSGRRFDPAVMAGLDLSQAVLAGGLKPSNVAEVVARFRPFGVDTAGGVESSPGRKDSDLVKEFVDNAKSA